MTGLDRRGQSRFRIAPPDTAPIATINTTPMIDMMLVLLILFIVSIPVRTHNVPLDLPQPGPARRTSASNWSIRS